MTPTVDLARFDALGTTVEVAVTDAGGLDAALGAVHAEVGRVDQACSRFRPDSDLARVNAAGGRWTAVSDDLLAALEAALRAARLTGGVVDPTVGSVLRRLGYDRDFAAVAPEGPAVRLTFAPVAGWTAVEVDRSAGRLRVPEGVELDLGATAKAWCADRAAARAAGAAGCGVLVSLGGDVAVAGPAPHEGWPVVVGDDHRAPLDAGGPVVGLRGGGLATSGTTVRRWVRGTATFHHVVDPATGAPAEAVWRTVSVTAGTCADANTASTAAVVLGRRAPAWLAALGLPARLVSAGGAVTTVGDWPPEVAA